MNREKFRLIGTMADKESKSFVSVSLDVEAKNAKDAIHEGTGWMIGSWNWVAIKEKDLASTELPWEYCLCRKRIYSNNVLFNTNKTSFG